MNLSSARIKPRTTMLTRLMIPMLFVFVLQAFVVVSMFLEAGILKKITQQSYEGLDEKVRNRGFYIETDMLKKWTNLGLLEDEIVSSIESKALSANISTEELLSNPNITDEILKKIFPYISQTLRRNSVTGLFFVINSSVREGENEFYQGLYLRDKDPDSDVKDDEDLLFVKGSSEIAQFYKINLGASWSPLFAIEPKSQKADDKYFTVPIESAKRNPLAKSSDLSYWCSPLNSTRTNDKIISYSIPVMGQNGKVYGVLGIDVSFDYLQRAFDFDELTKIHKGVYSVGLMEKDADGPVFIPLFVNKTTENFFLRHRFKLNEARASVPNIYSIEDRRAFGTRQCVSVYEFDLYGKEHSGVSDNWVLVGIVPEKELLSSYFLVKKVLIQGILIGSILFFVGVFLSSKHISNTLNRIVLQLENNDSLKPIGLEKMNIKELDALIYAIENMSVKIFNSASRVSKIVEHVQVPIGVFEHNTLLGTVFCNSIWFKLFNITKYEEDVNLPDTEFYKMIEDLEYYIHSQKDGKIIYAIPTGEPGKVRWIRFSRIRDNEKVLGIATDITKETEERHRFEIQMNYDELTGLHNRASFDRKLSEIFKNKNLGISALIMWDIDNLKFINDSYGYPYGDAYLQTFAKKLASLQQDRCIVARRSGDEFYTLFYGYSTSDEIKLLLNTFWRDIEKSEIKFPDGEDSKLRVSAGMAWYPYDADNLEDLIRYADFAIYNVKHSYKGSLQEFDLDIYKKNSVLVQGTEAFNRMIEKNLINYALQPIIIAGTGSIYGYEMLMRPAVDEFSNPEDVLRVARTQSKLHKIEEISFFSAMDAFTQKIESGEIPPNAKVFLNTISSQILSDIKFSEFEERFRPYLSNIVLEITESEPLNTAVYSIKNELMQKWNAMVAIDDFGSGYSNDSSLVFLAPNLVKIDMSIVRNVHESLDKQNILENLVSYAKKRGIIVLAEGVECVEEIDILLRFGVDLFQGFFFAKPSTEIKQIPDDRLKVLSDMYSSY